MEKYFKKFSIMFVMLLTLMLRCCVSAFAEDGGLVGINNLNGTAENSAKVGDILSFPEIGWARYDDTDSNISYNGSFTHVTQDGGKRFYENSLSYSKNVNDNIEFNFIGTKIRILDNKCNNRSSNIEISIDGQSSVIGEYEKDDALNQDGDNIVFQKTGLNFTEHKVKITLHDNNLYLALDSLDIDKNGQLKPYNENTSSLESIMLNKSSINLTEGDYQSLIATTSPVNGDVKWTSSNESVAKYDVATGNVVTVGQGTCIITATINDGSNLSATCTVNVTNPITPGITLNKTSDSLTIGQTDNLVATTTPSGAQVTWTSSDINIATVDSTGKITAIKAGTVTITANTPDGVTASATVTVANATGGNVTPTNPTDNSGGTSTGTDGTSNIVNIAYAKGENTNNAGGDVSIIFNGLPDTTLSVVKTADVKSVYVGDTFTYTIVATNTGAKTAKSVVISDSAPNHIQFMPSGITTTQGTVDPSSTSSNILVNVGDIPPLGTVTIKIPATVVM